LSLLEEEGIAVPPEARQAAELTPFAVITRYPGTARPIKEQDYERALAIAVAVVQWAEELVS